MPYDLTPLWLSLKLATVTTIVLTLIGIPLAYGLAFSRARGKPFLEALVSMPLVLPPTVLGFYILVFLSPGHALGAFLERILDMRVVFSFTGLVIGSVIFSLPFMVNPVKAGFQNFPCALIEAAYTLGKSRRQTLLSVIIPNTKASLLTGIVMSFAHTMGEFGVVLMIGGGIPRQTRVASIAIYNEVEAMNYSAANFYSLVLVVFSLVVLALFYALSRRHGEVV
jgi:molybdate transport system permease protein